MILVTADLHLNDLARDAYRHDWMRNILPSLLRKHRAERLIILGDLTDSKDEHNAWLTNSLVDHLSSIAKICPVVVQMGNHDYIQADCPFFEFLGKIPRLTWIGKPTVILDPDFGKALCLPHTHNPQRDWAEVDFDYDWFFTHQTYRGAAVGPRTLDGVDPRVFPQTANVVSGDIHQPQSFGPITYVGSPYLEDFGDQFYPRVLLIDKGKLKSVSSPGPQKRLVELRSITDLSKPNTRTNLYKGDILKVRFQLQPAQVPQWTAIKEEIKQWGLDNVYTIYLIQPQVDATKTRSMAKRKVGSKSDEDLLETYAKARAVSDATLTTGKKLMEKI
jgi:hypothetical protein